MELLDKLMSSKYNLEETVEILPSNLYTGRLYWTTTDKKSFPHTFIYNSDRDFRYLPFCNDFGPLDINLTYRFCQTIDSFLSDPEHSHKKIYYTSSTHPFKKANSAYLMGAYCIIVLKQTAEEAAKLFSFISVRFRDASSGPCYFFLSLFDCFSGLENAIKRNWFNYQTFNSAEYEFYSQLENGDLNWILPRQFVAFSSPADENLRRKQRLTAEKYSQIFKDLRVRTVIRLNKPKYQACKFVERGINHYDLHFKDGSTPTIGLVDHFIDICNSEQGAVAVHCKAGLGRTGTLIGCYAIKIFKFPAAAFIAWCRLCRPGSILGPQQQFLLDYEHSIRNKKKFVLNVVSHDSLKATLGDSCQGKKLVEAKTRNSTPNPRTRKVFEVKSTANSESNSMESTPLKERPNDLPVEKNNKFITEFRKIMTKFKPENQVRSPRQIRLESPASSRKLEISVSSKRIESPARSRRLESPESSRRNGGGIQNAANRKENNARSPRPTRSTRVYQGLSPSN